MDRDTPIILASFEGIGLATLDGLDKLTFPAAMIVLLLGTLYLIWRTAK